MHRRPRLDDLPDGESGFRQRHIPEASTPRPEKVTLFKRKRTYLALGAVGAGVVLATLYGIGESNKVESVHRKGDIETTITYIDEEKAQVWRKDVALDVGNMALGISHTGFNLLCNGPEGKSLIVRKDDSITNFTTVPEGQNKQVSDAICEDGKITKGDKPEILQIRLG